jgi:hypothetical protein
MLHVSVSNLNEFRRYKTRDEMSFADLMQCLRGEAPVTDKMLAGRALHSVLETVRDTELTTAENSGVMFNFKLNAQIALAPIKEMRGHRDYDISGTTLRLSGRVDSLSGLTIEDHKLTGQFDADRYHDSYQWRSYLSIFGAQKFTYNVFLGKQVNNPGETPEWTIYDLHAITFWRYPELETDLVHELNEFKTFADEYLRSTAA